MAGGDPKSFPVQFALLLTGHVSVIREAPDALRKVIAEEVQKIMGPFSGVSNIRQRIGSGSRGSFRRIGRAGRVYQGCCPGRVVPASSGVPTGVNRVTPPDSKR